MSRIKRKVVTGLRVAEGKKAQREELGGGTEQLS